MTDQNKITHLKDLLTQAIDNLVQAAFSDGLETGREAMRDELRRLLDPSAPAKVFKSPSPIQNGEGQKLLKAIPPEQLSDWILGAIQEFAEESPDGVGPPALQNYLAERNIAAGAHEIRLILKSLQLSGQIKRVENGRYVPVEQTGEQSSTPQGEAAAE